MSETLDRFLFSNVPPLVELQKKAAQTVRANIEEAMERMQIAVSDSYENISVLSMYWESDNTGAEDSSLFIETISKLRHYDIHSKQRTISQHIGEHFRLGLEALNMVESQPGTRRLFILHYAGHSIAGSTLNSLITIPKLGQELGKGPQVDMTAIIDTLKLAVSALVGLDILFVMDSCCASIGGRGEMVKGSRVEYVAATSCKGISNSREDGKTFTQHWCEAFLKLLEIGTPFDCDDIRTDILSDLELEQYPSIFVLREGWELPIVFRPCLGPAEPSHPTTVASRTVVTAIHIREDPHSHSLNQLINYLESAPVPITVLAVLPTSSTLLLIRVPVFLQEMLELPRIAFLLD